MPQTRTLYRKSSGEVLKIAVEKSNGTVQEFPSPPRNDTIFGVGIDALHPDGTKVRDGQGPLRQLGFAQIYIPASNTTRLATQPEIDTWAAAEIDDDNQLDAEQASDLLNSHPRMRKLLTAFADIIKDEINILRAIEALPARTLVQLRDQMSARISKDD